MDNIVFRYFVKNPAPILQIERLRKPPCKFVPVRCGNAGGFFWGRWRVTWRRPFSKVWAFDGNHWVPAYTLKQAKDAGHG